MNQIEDFVDELAANRKVKKNFALNPKRTTSLPRELERLNRVRSKFVNLLHEHPYDTFFDESLLSKAAPNNKA